MSMVDCEPTALEFRIPTQTLCPTLKLVPSVLFFLFFSYRIEGNIGML